MSKKIADLVAEEQKEKDSLEEFRTEVKEFQAAEVRAKKAYDQTLGKLRVCFERTNEYAKFNEEIHICQSRLHEELHAQVEHENDGSVTASRRKDFADACLAIGEAFMDHREGLTSEQGEELFQRHPDLAMWELSALRVKQEGIEKMCEDEVARRCDDDSLDHCGAYLTALRNELYDINQEHQTSTNRCCRLQHCIARYHDSIDHYEVAHENLARLDTLRKRNSFLTAEQEQYAADIRKHKILYWEQTHLRHLRLGDRKLLQEQGYNDESELVQMASTLREVEWEAREAAEDVRKNEALKEVNEIQARSNARAIPNEMIDDHCLSPSLAATMVSDPFDDDSSLAPLLTTKATPVTARNPCRKGRRRSSELINACHPFDRPPAARRNSQFCSLSLPPRPRPEKIEMGSTSSTDVPPPIEIHDAACALREIGREADLLAEVFEVEAVNSSLTDEIAHMREKVEQRVLRNEIDVAHMREKVELRELYEQRELQEEIRAMQSSSAPGNVIAARLREQSDCQNDLWEKVAEMREHEEQRCLLSEILDLKLRTGGQHVVPEGSPNTSSGATVSTQRLGSQHESSLSTLQIPSIEKLLWQHASISSVTSPTAPLSYRKLPIVPLHHEKFATMLETHRPLFTRQHTKLPRPPVEVWAAA